MDLRKQGTFCSLWWKLNYSVQFSTVYLFPKNESEIHCKHKIAFLVEQLQFQCIGPIYANSAVTWCTVFCYVWSLDDCTYHVTNFILSTTFNPHRPTLSLTVHSVRLYRVQTDDNHIDIMMPRVHHIYCVTLRIYSTVGWQSCAMWQPRENAHSTDAQLLAKR